MAHVKKSLSALYEHMMSLYEGFTVVRNGAVSTGCPALDLRTGGLRPGELTLVAGRPGVGKSGLLLSLARAADRGGAGAVVLVAPQWHPNQSALRLLAAASGVPAARLATHTVRDEEWATLTRAAVEMASGTIHLVHALPDGTGALRALAAEQSAGPDVGLVAVDHLGLVPPIDAGCPCRALPDAARRLRQLARDLDAPVVAAVELATPEGRPPATADLVALGLEPALADDVWLVHRPDDPGEGAAHWLEFTLYRSQGWTRSARLLFDPSTLRFPAGIACQGRSRAVH